MKTLNEDKIQIQFNYMKDSISILSGSDKGKEIPFDIFIQNCFENNYEGTMHRLLNTKDSLDKKFREIFLSKENGQNNENTK